MGGRIILLSDYRELKLDSNGETSKTSPVRSKQPPHRNFAHRAAIGSRDCPARVNSSWRDYKHILPAIFFLSCLALVAFGL